MNRSKKTPAINMHLPTLKRISYQTKFTCILLENSVVIYTQIKSFNLKKDVMNNITTNYITKTIRNRKKIPVYVFVDLKSVLSQTHKENNFCKGPVRADFRSHKFRFFPLSNLLIMKLYNKSVNQLSNVRRCPD